MLRLNLGSGGYNIDGYTAIDRKLGHEAYPLIDYADATVDEIRASHVLEHISHRQTAYVLKDWVRALKPGGVLRIAVPDFDKAIVAYNSADPLAQAYIMGGHTDADDVHQAIFNHETLAQLMLNAGLVNIEPWQSEIPDCASLPVSLNLQGKKPEVAPSELKLPKCRLVGSVPRLGFVGNELTIYQIASRYGIPVERMQGALWGQCLQRGLEKCVQEGIEWVITYDYDTVATWREFDHMVRLMQKYPHADAIAPLQMKRNDPNLLIGLCKDDGSPFTAEDKVTTDYFNRDLVRCKWAHFGFTIIRVAALRKMQKPWFKGEPAADGSWGDGRIDDDIWFWQQFEKAGNKAYVAGHVAIGHLQQIATWPNATLTGTIYQHVEDFTSKGAPLGARK